MASRRRVFLVAIAAEKGAQTMGSELPEKHDDTIRNAQLTHDRLSLRDSAQRAKADPPKLILNPDFQRKYKWDKDGWGRASKFIELCLMRIPLPSCYFAEDDKRAHLVPRVLDSAANL